MQLSELPGSYAVARSDPTTPVPAALFAGAGLVSVSRTPDELSVVAPQSAVAGMDRVEPGWTAFRVGGPLAFDETGIVAGLARPLAEAAIGIFVISTFDTDYILVKRENAARAAGAWRGAGHIVTDIPR